MMSRSQIDALDFGVVKVKDDCTIELFNRYESELASVPISEAEGKKFFGDIAPCTNNRIIKGKFVEGVAAGRLDAVIPYTFTYRMKPTNVTIHLYHDQMTKSNWVLVKKR
jgi:photoactive yellow protein